MSFRPPAAPSTGEELRFYRARHAFCGLLSEDVRALEVTLLLELPFGTCCCCQLLATATKEAQVWGLVLRFFFVEG